MYHNINSGRLRNYVEFYTPSVESDEYGRPTGDSAFEFDAYAEVRTVSGHKNQDYGTTTNTTIITCLMWYDNRARDNQVLVHEGVEYTVTHVNPDNLRKAMIVTCEIVKK